MGELLLFDTEKESERQLVRGRQPLHNSLYFTIAIDRCRALKMR